MTTCIAAVLIFFIALIGRISGVSWRVHWVVGWMSRRKKEKRQNVSLINDSEHFRSWPGDWYHARTRNLDADRRFIAIHEFPPLATRYAITGLDSMLGWFDQSWLLLLGRLARLMQTRARVWRKKVRGCKRETERSEKKDDGVRMKMKQTPASPGHRGREGKMRRNGNGYYDPLHLAFVSFSPSPVSEALTKAQFILITLGTHIAVRGERKSAIRQQFRRLFTQMNRRSGWKGEREREREREKYERAKVNWLEVRAMFFSSGPAASSAQFEPRTSKWRGQNILECN